MAELWIQDLLESQEFELVIDGGEANLADIIVEASAARNVVEALGLPRVLLLRETVRRMLRRL